MIIALNESRELEISFGVDNSHGSIVRSITKFNGLDFVTRKFRPAYMSADNGKIRQFEIIGK